MEFRTVDHTYTLSPDSRELVLLKVVLRSLDR